MIYAFASLAIRRVLLIKRVLLTRRVLLVRRVLLFHSIRTGPSFAVLRRVLPTFMTRHVQLDLIIVQAQCAIKSCKVMVLTSLVMILVFLILIKMRVLLSSLI